MTILFFNRNLSEEINISVLGQGLSSYAMCVCVHFVIQNCTLTEFVSRGDYSSATSAVFLFSLTIPCSPVMGGWLLFRCFFSTSSLCPRLRELA